MPDTVRVEANTAARLSAEEQDRVGRRIFEKDYRLLTFHRLDALDVDDNLITGKLEVTVAGGSDPYAVREWLSARYGDLVVEWVGPSLFQERPTPFGSWETGKSRLTVFYGLDHNGDRLADAAVIEETHDRVVVTLTRREFLGLKTLIGGFQRHRIDLALSAPLADRTVIDAADDVERPQRWPED